MHQSPRCRCASSADSMVSGATAMEKPAAEVSAPAAAEEDEEVEHAEMTLFQCRECFVYQIPPASTIGHRAELWNVDNWLQEVSLSVVSQHDDCWVRLFDKAGGELFAECPIPQNAPLVTVVEPVVDSSRYYVLRIEDRESRRHAFIGIGFRERGQASDFNAALDDHLQYLRRKLEAARLTAQYAAAAAGEGDSKDGTADSHAVISGPARDLALKPGETIKVALPSKARDTAGTTPPATRLGAMAAKARANFVSPTPVKMGRAANSGDSPPALLAPPPRPVFPSPPSAACNSASPAAAASSECGGSGRPSLSPSPTHAAQARARLALAGQQADASQAASSAGGADSNSASAADDSGSRELRSFHARFSQFQGESEDAGGNEATPAGRFMRVSLVADEDAETTSLAGLSLKAHTSGGSSLAGCSSLGGSDFGEGSTVDPAEVAEAAEEVSPEPMQPEDAPQQGAPTQKDDWGDFVS